MSKRLDALSYAQTFIGSRYQWAAEGPYNVGFDCSGYILEILRSVGLWGKEDGSAQNIHDRMKAKTLGVYPVRPDQGMLVFFGESKDAITHVGIMLNNYQFIEAGGGDSKSVDKGMVRIRPLSWRKDLVAWLDIIKE